MSPLTVSDLIQVLPLVVIVLVVVLARRNLKRVPDWGSERQRVQLQQEPEGAQVVPVSQLIFRTRWRGSHNGLSPKLWITTTGLRFKVLKLSERRFEDFTRVDARKDLFYGTRLIFVGDGEWLHALMPQRAAARAVLRSLPSHLPLTPSAAALRGES